jgi:hypothetical protein
MSVKDKTGATIGKVATLKTEAGGGQTATIQMGPDTFATAAANLTVQNGAAVINMSAAELRATIKAPKS